MEVWVFDDEQTSATNSYLNFMYDQQFSRIAMEESLFPGISTTSNQTILGHTVNHSTIKSLIRRFYMWSEWMVYVNLPETQKPTQKHINEE